MLFDGSLCYEGADLVRIFFNTAFRRGRFIRALGAVVKRADCVLDYDFCLFPDYADADPYCHFEGVRVGIGSTEELVDEVAFGAVINEACERYVALFPEERGRIDAVLRTREI